MIRARHNNRPRHTSGQMNGLEKAYAERLKLQQMAGEIVDFKFEAMKFRLAKATFYTPDFVVFRPDGLIECHEVKGHWEDDARVKIKVFAEMYPFEVIGVSRKRGEWKTENFTK